MITDRITDDDARDGFLLDGFPAQQESGRRPGRRRWPSSDRRLTAALLIEVPDDEVVRRLAGRRTCVKNGSHIYHVEFDPPKHEGVCDQDGARLIQRDDDKEETIRKRLDVYHRQTSPLIDYYERAGLLRRFDGRRKRRRGARPHPRHARHRTPGGAALAPVLQSRPGSPAWRLRCCILARDRG